MLLPALCACDALRYYHQSVRGQLDLLERRKPIEALIADPATPVELQATLRYALQARQFAASALKLPVDGQFSTYADLERPFAVWSVFAAPEFSLEAKTWCYPIVGCAAYRGYFSPQAAHEYAAQLSAQGFDVAVEGIPAYSTLGWFDDPLPSTVIQRRPVDLAALIFHELAHQVLYLPDDTTFNESFATVVEQEGVRLWLEQRGEHVELQRFQNARRQEEQFIALLLTCRNRLEQLYRSGEPVERLRQGKLDAFDALRAAYRQAKRRCPGEADFDAWFDSPLNNARLVPIAAYHDLVPGFSAWLQSLGGDFEAFFAGCRELGHKARSERHDFLRRLSAGSHHQAVAQ
jgi:predicted aminopeptidase